jgi:hypothetical protein
MQHGKLLREISLLPVFMVVKIWMPNWNSLAGTLLHLMILSGKMPYWLHPKRKANSRK